MHGRKNIKKNFKNKFCSLFTSFISYHIRLEYVCLFVCLLASSYKVTNWLPSIPHPDLHQDVSGRFFFSPCDTNLFCKRFITYILRLHYIYIYVLQHLFDTLFTRNHNVERLHANFFSLCLALRILSIGTRWKFGSFKCRSCLSPGKEPLTLFVSVTKWIPWPVYTR